MLGGILKLTFSFSVFFLFVILLWQSSIADALPALPIDDNMVKSNEDMSPLLAINSHTGATVKKRSLHTTVDQHSLIDRLYSPSHQRYFKNIFHSNKKKSSSNFFRSAGTDKKNLRAAKRMKNALENRLKRFRMLDQDEFQEMLKSLSQQSAEDQSKASNGIDAIDGMQLANYWSPV